MIKHSIQNYKYIVTYLKPKMPTLLFFLTLALSVLISKPLLSLPMWSGSTQEGYVSACVTSATNARTTPSLSDNNIRAIFRQGSCGQVLHIPGGLVYSGSIPLYENGFYLLRFWVEELGGYRQYWIHESQLTNY